MAFPSLLQAIQGLALALDDGTPYTSSAGSTTTTVIGSLIDNTPNASTHTYDGRWMANVTQSISRLVRNGGYIPASGSLTIDPPWTAPATNDQMLMTQYFPIVEDVRPETSYRTLIDRALGRMLIPDRLSIAIVPGAQQFSAAEWASWLDSEDRFGHPPQADGTPKPRMLEPGPTNNLQIPADWRNPRLRLDGEAPYFEIDAPFAAGTTGNLAFAVMRPANTWLEVGGTPFWTDTTNIVNLTDLMRVSVQDVVDVALEEAYHILWQRGVHSPAGSWADKYADQKGIAQGVIDRLAGKRPAPVAAQAA